MLRTSHFFIPLGVWLFKHILCFQYHTGLYTIQECSYLGKRCPSINMVQNEIDPNNESSMQRFHSPWHTHQMLIFDWYDNFDTIVGGDYRYYAFTWRNLLGVNATLFKNPTLHYNSPSLTCSSSRIMWPKFTLKSMVSSSAARLWKQNLYGPLSGAMKLNFASIFCLKLCTGSPFGPQICQTNPTSSEQRS